MRIIMIGMPQPSRASRFIDDWLKLGTSTESHTQEALARRISERVGREVSQSTISNIKNGSQSPRADLVAAFGVELGIPVEWWLPEPSSSATAIEDADPNAA